VGFGGVVWGAFGFVVTLELFAPVRNHFFLGGFLAVLALSSGREVECRYAIWTESDFHHLGIIWVDTERST